MSYNAVYPFFQASSGRLVDAPGVYFGKPRCLSTRDLCHAARDNDVSLMEENMDTIFEPPSEGDPSLVECAFNGYTPLHIAAANGAGDMVSFLISQGLDRNVLDKDGNTPLFWAVSGGHVGVVEILLNLGASVSACNWHTGDSPLAVAAARGMNDVVRILVRAGANVNRCNLVGATPVHAAAAAGQASTVELLGSYGACMDVGDEEGDSAVHYCVREGQEDAARTLLRCGANVNGANCDGETPLDLARACGSYSFMAILSNYGGMGAGDVTGMAATAVDTKELGLSLGNIGLAASAGEDSDEGRSPHGSYQAHHATFGFNIGGGNDPNAAIGPNEHMRTGWREVYGSDPLSHTF